MIIGLEKEPGAGGTTTSESLARYLRSRGHRVKCFVESIPPKLLAWFLDDMEKNAFPFQVIVVNRRRNIFEEAKRFVEKGGIAIIDRSSIGDLAFAIYQRKIGNISAIEWEVYIELLETDGLPSPDCILYLSCTVETLHRRLIRRMQLHDPDGNHEKEVKKYDPEYLTGLRMAHNEAFQKFGGRLIRLDWNTDFQLVDKMLPDWVCSKIFTCIQHGTEKMEKTSLLKRADESEKNPLDFTHSNWANIVTVSLF